jgi:hypothetical protein
MPFRDDDAAGIDPGEYPEPDAGDDGDDTAPCPHCRAPVYADAERCPHCEAYLSEEDAPARHPWWVLVGGLLALAVALLWALQG